MHTAYIFGWTATFATETNRSVRCAVRWQDTHQENLVPPVVIEVVLVDQRVAFRLQDAGKLRLALVDKVVLKFISVTDALVLAVLLELMQVAVRPEVVR